MNAPRTSDDLVKVLVTCPKCEHTHAITVSDSDLRPNRTERFYRLAEVEKMFGVSRRTVKQWIYDKKLEAQKLSERGDSYKGAPWFVSESAIRRFREKYRRHG